MGSELFQADRRIDIHDETNTRFRNFGNAPKMGVDWHVNTIAEGYRKGKWLMYVQCFRENRHNWENVL